MIVVTTSVRIDGARFDDVTDTVADLVDASRDVEGIRHYAAARDLTDPSVLRFVEVYEDAEVAAKQEDLPAARRFIETLPEVTDSDIESRQFETDDLHHIEYSATEAVAAIE